jgi:hypothetical protein
LRKLNKNIYLVIQNYLKGSFRERGEAQSSAGFGRPPFPPDGIPGGKGRLGGEGDY